MNSTCELGRHAARALKPYPDYKTSGVQWLGKVPAHWEVAPVKQKYAIRLGKMLQPARRASDDCRISYLKAKHVQWFEVRTNDIDTMWATPDEVDRYGIVAGDLLVCEGGEGGRCGIVKHGTALPDPCIIQNALHRVRPRSWGSVGDISRNDYLQYMMSTVASTGWFDVLTDKATIAHFTAKKFGALLASIPPLPEQAAIVRFLDHAGRRIRRYIRAKQQLIALLEEQKQVIIHQAVTGQINVRTGKPYQAYKPSGVEWFEVPAHWEVRPAKGYFQEADERSETGSEELLSVSHITGVTPRSEKNITMFMAVSNVGYKLCRPGDLVINTMWAWMAALGVASQTGIVSPSYAVYRPHRSSRLLGEYADLLLQTVPYKSEYICRSTGIRSSRLRMYPKEFLRIKLLCPPPEEQRAIVEIVSKESVDARRAIDLAQGELSLLREYRTSLIADVVTGKLDVREAAARLPDEVEELEPLDEADALIGGEEEPTDALATAP